MTADQKTCLKIMAVARFEGGSDFSCFHFNSLSHLTGFDRRRVRLACRGLARKGLVKHQIGLHTADGEFYGAGYGCTDAGFEMIKTELAL